MGPLFSYLRPHLPILALAGLAMVGESLAALATPWLAGRFAASLAADGSKIRQLLLLWALLLTGQAVLRYLGAYLVTRSGARFLATLSSRLYEHLQALPLTYLQGRRRGDLLALFSNDAAVLAHFLTGTLAGVLPQLLVLAGAFFMMWRLDPLVAGWAAALVPLFFLVLKWLGRSIRPVSTALMQQQAEALAVAEENLGLLPLVKAFNRQAAEAGRFRREIRKVLRLRQRQLHLQAMLGPALQLMASLGILFMLWLAGGRMLAGQLTMPQLVSLLLYGLLFARPVSGLANLYGQLQQAKGAVRRIAEIFAVAPEPGDRGRIELQKVRGEIEFRRLHFRHPGGPELFGGLDLRVAPGETVAITGPNGAGKTTLLHLLMRFIEPQEGEILIDGTELREITLASLRRHIGLVSQPVLLADASVAENIRYGHPQATREEVKAAARAAHAHDFITALPEGYDTRVGAEGQRLSGGQRQRIALARALLGDPPILLLDEATAMLDAEGERRFIEESRPLLERRTVLLVSHRPATLALADRVVELGGA